MVAIEGDDMGAPPEGLEGVAPAAAPEVEQKVAAPHAEAVVVDGQHARVPAAASSAAFNSAAFNSAAFNSARYCATVPSAVAAQV